MFFLQSCQHPVTAGMIALEQPQQTMKKSAPSRRARKIEAMRNIHVAVSAFDRAIGRAVGETERQEVAAAVAKLAQTQSAKSARGARDRDIVEAVKTGKRMLELTRSMARDKVALKKIDSEVGWSTWLDSFESKMTAIEIIKACAEPRAGIAMLAYAIVSTFRDLTVGKDQVKRIFNRK